MGGIEHRGHSVYSQNSLQTEPYGACTVILIGSNNVGVGVGVRV